MGRCRSFQFSASACFARSPAFIKTMTIVGNSVPSSNYAVNVRCVQVIRVCHHLSSQLVEWILTNSIAEHAPLVQRHCGTLSLTGNLFRLRCFEQLTCPLFYSARKQRSGELCLHSWSPTRLSQVAKRSGASISHLCLLPLVNYLTTAIWFDDRSRLRTYTFVLFKSESEVVCQTYLGTETNCPHWESM